MNKNAKLLGAVALSLGTVFSSGCSSLGPRNSDNNDDHPATSDVRGLSRIFNTITKSPMSMVDGKLAQKIISMAQRDQISPGTILAHRIEMDTGVQPTPDSIRNIGVLISRNMPAAFRVMSDPTDSVAARETLCLVYADLPGETGKGPLQAMLQIDPDTINDVIPELDASKIKISDELGERMIKLHEGFHCADRWYAPARYALHEEMQKSKTNYAEDSALRLQGELLVGRAETFADVAMVLKMAQEGHKDIIASHIAIRSVAQAHAFATRMLDPGFASSTLARTSGLQPGPQTGWPDNLTYVPVPGLAHNTTKGLLAAQEFVQSKWDWQLRTMSMEDIMQKAHEITESTTMTADQLRGLSFAMWGAPRAIIGETTGPLAEKLCPPPCATGITQRQRDLGDVEIQSYKQTLNRAMYPFIKTP